MLETDRVSAVPISEWKEFQPIDSEAEWYRDTYAELESGQGVDVPVYYLSDPQKDNAEAAKEVVRIMREGKPIIQDYFSTYGLAGLPSSVQVIRAAKNEANINRPFGITAAIKDILPFIDKAQVHPDFRDTETLAQFAGLMKNQGFLRFPVLADSKKVPQQAVNDGQVQVFCKNYHDALLTALREIVPEMPMYLVTSANKKGESEVVDPVYAYDFAKEVHAGAFVMANTKALHLAAKRLKFGSTPIIQLPRVFDVDPITHSVVVTVYRSANTSVTSIERLIHETFSDVVVKFAPEKPEDSRRLVYSLSEHQQKSLRSTLFLAGVPGGLL